MDDARPRMCFSSSPPPSVPKAIFSSNLTFGHKCSSDNFSFQNTNYHCQDYNKNNTVGTKEQDNMQRLDDITNVDVPRIDEETTSDYKQWLHAMKLVARLPGGIPPEFRRKLWLSLADKYLKSKTVDWSKEEEKCFCEKWREDDEELGIQIVKDLHRTGSTLCTGPAGDLNQAKLKRILLGYARYNPEVGYCQGFNMLGALILQVMDKSESESIKVMIYLVEGILPTGYFCGSMGGLQADMAVFRELMQTKLPRLAKHLQKLQGPIENAYEPPLTNVFTMQWFLTMFCTCLPMSCVLRVWDLVLIEGSDVLLRTALALWSLLEERVLSARSADDFYGKMGSFSSELLNGHLIDSNGLIEKVVQLGPIADIQKLRDKHLCSIAPLERQQGLQLYFDDDEPDIDEDSRLAVATVWGIPWGRRGSQGQPNNNIAKPAIESKDRLALDISLLKKQYDRLRERQKQAQIILTTVCTTASRHSSTSAPLPVNQLLSGRPAIVTNRGRRSGPLVGAIPPARKPSLPAVLHDKTLEKQLRRGETLYWRGKKDTESRRDSLSWKEIKAERAAMISSESIDGLRSQKIRSGRLGKSDSSSYSEESDDNEADAVGNASSSDTSLCDDDLQPNTNDKKHPLHPIAPSKAKKATLNKRNQSAKVKDATQKARPKSWAPSNTEIPFVLMTGESPNLSADENPDIVNPTAKDNCLLKEKQHALAEELQTNLNEIESFSDDIVRDTFECKSAKKDFAFLSTSMSFRGNNGKNDNIGTFDISNEGVTNEYFERVNSTERPTKLDLLYSLNEDENVRDILKIEDDEEYVKTNKEERLDSNDRTLDKSNSIRCMDLLVDYSEKSSAACIEEAKSEISTTFQSVDTSTATSQKSNNMLKRTKSSAEKRRDPRRLTLTRSSTMDIEKRYEAFEKRFSMEIYSNHSRFSDETEFDFVSDKKLHQSHVPNITKSNNANSDRMNHNTLSTEKCASPNKKIPSTADLEQRFANIQQQLVRDRSRMIKSPTDSENSEKQPNFKSSTNNNIESSYEDKTVKLQRKPHDTGDSGKSEGSEAVNACSINEEKSKSSNELEDINNAGGTTKDTQSNIIRVPESTISEINPSLQNKKEPPDENKDGDIVNKDELSENSASEIDSRDTKKTDDKEGNSKFHTETVEEPIVENRESMRISPPSTEELEKRFSALEEQINSAKGEANECKKQTKSGASFENSDEPVKVSKKIEHENMTKMEMDTRKTDAPSLEKFETLSEKNTKRRLSEPPSTEDLERRYEVLKRRMSSRNFETKILPKDTVAVARQQENKVNLNKTVINSPSKRSPPSIENLEERFKKLQSKNESKSATIMESPPSTENLEERFEKLQSKTEAKIGVATQSSHSQKISVEHLESPQGDIEKSEYNTEDQASNENNAVKDVDKNSFDRYRQTSEKNEMHVEEDEPAAIKPASPLYKNANKIKMKLIEELQAKIREHSISTDVESIIEKKTTIIEELKTKIDRSQDKFLKPTQISSRRQPPSYNHLLPSLSFNDETLESHATSAYRRSGKHEPTNANANRKMVRRFSDLPSRADLENRLKFLEQQLNKTVCMQRRSSDSEVASNARLKHKMPLNTISPSDSLEYRVQELEKRLKDNRTFSMDVATNEKCDADIEISQVELATDTAAVTGKELVRYSSHGEAGDIEHQNPINISISIQMTLNKDDMGINKRGTETSKSDEIDRRLQFLEQQLKTSMIHKSFKSVADTPKESITGRDVERSKSTTNNVVENEANSDQIEICDIENVDITPYENTQDISELDKKDVDIIPATQPSLVNKSSESILDENQANVRAENVQVENKIGDPKEPESNLQTDKADNSPQDIETIQRIENTKSVDTKEADTVHEAKILQKQLTLVKEDKEKENNIIASQTDENKAVGHSKSEEMESGSNTSKKSPQDSLSQDEKLTNSIQHDTKTKGNEINDVPEVVQLHEHSDSQPSKTTESKICEQDGTKGIKQDENSETKTASEVDKLIGLNNCSQFVPVEVNKKTLVLLLDNEPKAVKVRRLTRANTQELEDLFQALEKQLSDRGQHKVLENTCKIVSDDGSQNEIDASMSDLAKEIEAFSKIESNSNEQDEKFKQEKQKKQEEEFDWGSDPIKYHLKKRTVYLPSTKELEARFRSLERQIKLLEDVEKIDVEQRLIEIERKIKLQYSLSHEKDLNKFLELCDGKDPDDIPALQNHQDRKDVSSDHKCNSRHTSPNRLKESSQPRNLEYSYLSHDMKRSKSKQCLKKQPIHPLEMLLDPSPDDSNIPTTGELEHRIRVMEENRRTPSSPSSRKSRSQSPPIKQSKAIPNTHILTASPKERELPTAEELEARLEALEKEQCFNFKMQKNFQQFNQKLKDVVSPSLSFDEFKSPTKTNDSAQKKIQSRPTSKRTKTGNATSPKAIRFYEEEQSLSRKEIESTKSVSENKESHSIPSVCEGLGVMGIRLMRETSPLRRKGTHTGVPLRTGENINDQLTSIQNTIKSIDSLCEEKPYRKEKCQQYIDALFSDSTYFAHKKTSLEDLTSHNLSRSTSREIGPSIRISDQSPAFSRSMGSADSIHSSSPLRSLSPLQYRSNRDLRRELSPRRRREEEREEHESRVRRDNLLPNNINYSHSILSHTSHNSLIKFHKVDSQLIPNDVENEHEHEESLGHPRTFSTIGNTLYHDNTNTSNNVNATSQGTPNAEVTTLGLLKGQKLDRPLLPLFPTTSSNTPVYTPAKLEIRHTTVTSTFYDRVLTEKQLEKQHHLSFSTNNNSPLISPQYERHGKPTYQQQTTKSTTKILHNDTIDTLSDVSPGNYHRSIKQHIQTNDHS